MKQLLLLFLLSTIWMSCDQKDDTKPDDFEQFWSASLEELNTVPIESKKIGKDTLIGNKRIRHIKIRSFNDVYFHTWVSKPVEPGNYPVKIRFSGYGEENIKDNQIVHLWFLKQKGFINVLVDIRGQGLSKEQINPKDFLTEDLKDKETYIYRGAYMDAVRVVDFIAGNTNNNGEIIVTGGSQGGALSIVAAALNNKVSLCIAGFPFLTDIKNHNKNEWPMKIWFHRSKILNLVFFVLLRSLSYFDMLNFAHKIKVPVFIRTEEHDLITPPEGAVNFFDRISTQKKVLYVDPCKGHGCASKSRLADDLERVFIQKHLVPAN